MFDNDVKFFYWPSVIIKPPLGLLPLSLDCYPDEVLLLAMPKNDGWGGLADGTWAVCPGLARARRWRRFVCGGGYARGVVCLRFVVVLSVFSGWGPAACRFWEPSAGVSSGGRCGRRARCSSRVGVLASVLLLALCAWRCVRGVRVSGPGALPLGHGDCSVPINLWSNAGGSIDGHLPIVWRVPYKRVYPRLKAGDAIDASILMHGEGCMPQAAELCMRV